MSDDLHDGGFPPVSDPYGNGNGDGFPPPPPTPSVEEDPGNLPPFEDSKHHGPVSGFFETVRLVITEPKLFFTNHPVRRGLLMPILFCILVTVAGAAADWMWSQVFDDLGESISELFGVAESEESAFSPAVTEFLEDHGELLALLLSPFFSVIGLFVTSGLIHLGVMIATRNRDRGFEATLRVSAYGDAVNILLLVPGCGSLIALVWGIYVKIVGVREVHGLSTWASILTVIAPALLCLCSIAGLMGMTVALANL